MELKKPQFTTLKNIRRNGYNVIVRVISAAAQVIETREKLKITMVKAVVADESASADVFFKGGDAEIVVKDAVIAIRNGLRRIVKGHVTLGIDAFGRITKQKKDIKPNTELNISSEEIKEDRDRKPYRPRDRPYGNSDRRPHRPNHDREDRPRGGYRQQRDQNNDRPKRQYNDRPKRQYEDRPKRQHEDRPKRQYDDKPKRQYEDRPRKQYQNRDYNNRDYNNRDNNRDSNRDSNRDNNRDYNNRRQNDNRRGYDRQYDNRKPRNYDNRDYDRNNRNYQKPDRDFDRRRNGQNERNNNNNSRYQQKRQGDYREKRVPMNWVKVSQINPGEENLNFIVKVISAQAVKGKNSDNVRCVLADETASVNAFFINMSMKVGQSYAIFNSQAKVIKQHIQIQLGRNGRVDVSKRPIKEVNESVNISTKSYVPAD